MFNILRDRVLSLCSGATDFISDLEQPSTKCLPLVKGVTGGVSKVDET